MKTLYVTDLDGTLLNTKDNINEYSLRTINKLVEEGMLFTYATARSFVSASVVTQGLSTKIPIIAYNGAFIINPATGEVLSSMNFSNTEVDKIINCLKQYDISPMIYSYIDDTEKVSWVTTRENDGKRRYLSLRNGDRRLRPLQDDHGLYAGKVFYITCIGEREELLPIYEIFHADSNYTCTLQQELYRPEYWCEILPRQATKANAIKKLKSMWSCDRVVSFGDAINDIPMFQISDECYAVSNAVDSLKEIATGITESNDKDGVAKWLKDNCALNSGWEK